MKGNYEKLYAFAQLKNKPNSKPVLSAVEWANFTIPHPHTPTPPPQVPPKIAHFQRLNGYNPGTTLQPLICQFEKMFAS